MKDILTFKTMITPVIIQVIFWVGVLFVVISGIYGLFHNEILSGIFLIILGPLAIRVSCELLILFFRINATLTEIRNNIH